MILAVSVDTKLLGDNSGYKPVQPIAYSHALHAGELKLDCLFCHTGAEQSRHAGIPPASTCMKCHETILNKAGTKPGVSDPSPEIAKLARAVKEGRPIEWVRIHRLPSHVDFPHSRHVNGGVPELPWRDPGHGARRAGPGLNYGRVPNLPPNREPEAATERQSAYGAHRLQRLSSLRRSHARMEEPRRTAGTH
jgi:hypothetical protein